MRFYVIANKDQKQLETPVFGTGEQEQEEAIAAFTAPDLAAEYLQAADWEEAETVAELEPLPFLEWLLKLHRDEVRYIVVNPVREGHLQGIPQPTLAIEDLLTNAAAGLIDTLDSPPPPLPTETTQTDVFHCQKCGEVVRQRQGGPAPVCCDQAMVKAVTDVREEPIYSANDRASKDGTNERT